MDPASCYLGFQIGNQVFSSFENIVKTSKYALKLTTLGNRAKWLQDRLTDRNYVRMEPIVMLVLPSIGHISKRKIRENIILTERKKKLPFSCNLYIDSALQMNCWNTLVLAFAIISCATALKVDPEVKHCTDCCWIGMGWKSLQALILRAPLCGANNGWYIHKRYQ